MASAVNPDVFITVALPLLTFAMLAVGALMVLGHGPTTAKARRRLPVELDPPQNQPNPDTVQALLDGVQRMLDDEDRRGESLNTRGAAVAGLLGVVIALAGSLGATRFGSGGGYHDVAAGLASGALVAFLVSLGVIGWGVLLPAGGQAVAVEEVEQFPNWSFVGRTPVMVKGYLLQGAVGTLSLDRKRNNRKAVFLKSGYLFMYLGLMLVSAAGILVVAEGISHGSPRQPARGAEHRALPAPGRGKPA